jgi:hypothetical protein
MKINQTRLNLNNLDLITSKNTNGGFIFRKVLLSNLDKFFNDEKIILNKIDNIESFIKKVDPNFRGGLDTA